MELPLNSEVDVPGANGTLRSRRAKNGEVRIIHIQLQVEWEAVVQFVVRGVLAEIRILKLEKVELVEELKVPLPPLGYCGVIGIEGELSQRRRRDPTCAQQE
jgi:hypothetical protein